jgi:hypothetical protein
MSIRKFDVTNFNFWKEQMQDYLIVRGYIDRIEHDTAPATYKPEVWAKLDRVARATIRMHLSESVYLTVQACTTASELWKTLSDTYEKKVADVRFRRIFMTRNRCISPTATRTLAARSKLTPSETVVRFGAHVHFD